MHRPAAQLAQTSSAPAHLCSHSHYIWGGSLGHDPQPLRPPQGARGAWRGGRRRARAGRRTRWTRLLSAGSAPAPSSTISQVSSWRPAAIWFMVRLRTHSQRRRPCMGQSPPPRRAGAGRRAATRAGRRAPRRAAEPPHLDRSVQRNLDRAQLERQHVVALQAVPRPPAPAPGRRLLSAARALRPRPRRARPRRRRACTDGVLRAAWRTRALRSGARWRPRGLVQGCRRCRPRTRQESRSAPWRSGSGGRPHARGACVGARAVQPARGTSTGRAAGRATRAHAAAARAARGSGARQRRSPYLTLPYPTLPYPA
jgi:hypothetical protein